jgi:shikimate dehydrogenase
VTRRAAVLGRPVAHSLSPALHRSAYAVFDLDWQYDALDCDEQELAGLLEGLGPEWVGLSLTMPLKAAVIPLLDHVSSLARAVDAVNTVLLGPEGRQGDNTDVPGMVAALRASGVDRVDHAVILGGGATARSAVAALGGIADQLAVLVRSPTRAAEIEAVGDGLGVPLEVRPWADAADATVGAPLVVSTTPAGATDDLDLVGTGTLFDVVYDPWPTRLAERWRGPVVGGLELLVHQAALQVELMTGRPAPLDAMRAAGERALAARRAS